MLRKKFLKKVIVSSGTLFTVPAILLAESHDIRKQLLTDQLPPDKVKDFVIAGHGDLVKVKAMLQEIPTLLYATGIGEAAILKLHWKGQAMLATKKSQIT